MKTDITKNDLIDYINQNKDVIRFIALFITFCTVFYLFYYQFMDRFAFLENTTASILGFLLRIFGMDVTVSGNSVTIVGHIALKIMVMSALLCSDRSYISPAYWHTLPTSKRKP